MNIYDALTELDKDTILNYIDCMGEGSLSSSNLPNFLSDWATNKESIYHIFGDKFILSKDIVYDTPQSELQDNVSNAVTEYFSFFENLRGAIYNYALNIEWMDANEFCSTVFYRLKDASCLANNKIEPGAFKYYKHSYYDVPTPQGNRIRVAEGAKPMRILGKLARAFGFESQYEEFRIDISRCLNVAHLEGQLCLSIHPMDYMTMSDNDCDWHSCMSWSNDGEYKLGTLEMLGSPYCVIAYLTAKDPYKFRCYPDNVWNNKKWRQLLFIHPAFIVGNRHYPYFVPDVEEIAMNWLKELAEKADFSQYRNERIQLTNHSRNQFDDFSIYPVLMMDQMYNDLNKNWYYLATNIEDYFNKDSYSTDRLTVNLSGTAHCVDCGEPIYDPFDPMYLKCEHCQPHFTCSCCEEILAGEPEYINSSGEEFCYECINYSDNLRECDVCNELYYEQGCSYDIEDDIAGTVSHVCLCDSCYSAGSYKSLFGNFNPSGTFNAENITADGHSALDYQYKDFNLEEKRAEEEEYIDPFI